MSRSRKIPLITFVLLAVNVLVYGYVEFSGSVYDSEFMLNAGALYEPLLIQKHQYYRLITHFFLHFGFDHLVNNMVSLLILGYSLEMEMGKVRFIILYFLSGILAGITSIVYNIYVGQESISCGASGAIYGLMGALLIMLIVGNRGKFSSEVPRYLLYIGISIYSGMQDENIDNAAHIGGFVAGVLVCLIMSGFSGWRFHMKVNIYYGGRGLIDDPNLFVLEKITKVLDELRVTVERYNLYEDKRNITVLPKTLKDADGIILAASVEWFGIGGFLQQFLDACWLYGDKEKMANTYMLPVVMATTYGEREAEYCLIRAWEMLGGIPVEGLCAYVNNHVEFETNSQFNLMIEKKAENFYRMISKKAVAFPNSNMVVKKTALRSSNLSLTPQESEQLSLYVSNDNYVKKQKEDIEELANLFKGMLGDEQEPDEYVEKLKEHFYPMDGLQAVFQIDLLDENSSLIIRIEEEKLSCTRGMPDSSLKPDVIAKIRTKVFQEVLSGAKSFQSAFMSGDLSAQGNFKILRNFDTIFRF